MKRPSIMQGVRMNAEGQTNIVGALLRRHTCITTVVFNSFFKWCQVSASVFRVNSFFLKRSSFLSRNEFLDPLRLIISIRGSNRPSNLGICLPKRDTDPDFQAHHRSGRLLKIYRSSACDLFLSFQEKKLHYSSRKYRYQNVSWSIFLNRRWEIILFSFWMGTIITKNRL
jgi:hypothetical protein